MRLILEFLRCEDGPTAVEYAVLLSLILGTCMAAISTVGNPAREGLENSGDQIHAKMLESGVDF